jgi:hypothetical protein
MPGVTALPPVLRYLSKSALAELRVTTSRRAKARLSDFRRGSDARSAAGPHRLKHGPACGICGATADATAGSVAMLAA